MKDAKGNVKEYWGGPDCTWVDPTPQRFPSLYFFGNNPRDYPTDETVQKIMTWAREATRGYSYNYTVFVDSGLIQWLYKLSAKPRYLQVNYGGQSARLQFGAVSRYRAETNQQSATQRFMDELKSSLA